MINKIVIVDDDEFMLAKLTEIFKSQADYYIISLNDSTKAAEVIEAEQPSLVLIDLYMPKMNGLDVGYVLKNNPKTQDIPIIFMSGHPSLENAKLAFFLGAVDLIEKPFNPKELIEKAKASVHLYELKRMVHNFLRK